MDEKQLRKLLRERGILHPVNHPLSVGKKSWPGMGRIDRREFVKIAGLAGAVLATGVGGLGCTTPTSVVGEGPAPDPFERELALLAVDAARSAGATMSTFASPATGTNRSVHVKSRSPGSARATLTESASGHWLGVPGGFPARVN